MPMGRPKANLVLTDEEHEQLRSLARSRSLPAALTLRAKFVLAYAADEPNCAVATRFGTTKATVGKWRRRFIELRPGQAAYDRR
jgi:putative transposase